MERAVRPTFHSLHTRFPDAPPKLITSIPTTMHPSLQDDLAYHNAALSTQDLPAAEKEPFWRDFLVRYPDSDLADDAAFNIITARMNSIRTADPLQSHRIELETIRLLDDFLVTHRTSGLADDALFYKTRLLAHLGDMAGAWKTFQSLLARPAPL